MKRIVKIHLLAIFSESTGRGRMGEGSTQSLSKRGGRGAGKRVADVERTSDCFSTNKFRIRSNNLQSMSIVV